jgi:hypothetical protein
MRRSAIFVWRITLSQGGACDDGGEAPSVFVSDHLMPHFPDVEHHYDLSYDF